MWLSVIKRVNTSTSSDSIYKIDISICQKVTNYVVIELRKVKFNVFCQLEL